MDLLHQPVHRNFPGDLVFLSPGLATFLLEILTRHPVGNIVSYQTVQQGGLCSDRFCPDRYFVPSFFFATILKYIFSINLKWVDLYGIVSRMHESYGSVGKILDMAKHMILPVVTLTIVSVGSLMRYTRTNMLEVLNADYIRTARAKGVPEKKVIYHHAFRNTLIPIITILGSTLPSLFAGAMITETLFQIPGIGYTSYQALTQGDIPFTMFYMVFLAFLTLTGNLIADILYAVADPRVRIN